jgi:hypothetical protein
MHTGILWFDNSKSPLLIKIESAFKYYVKKYGRKPTLVLVHPSMLNGLPTDTAPEIDGAPVRPYRPVLPGHIWVGISDKE